MSTFLGQMVKTENGKPRVINTPYPLEIGEGDIEGHYPIRVFGSNDAAGAAIETVSEVQGLVTYPSADEVLQVSSAGAEDDVGGDGALTLKIWGLNDVGVEINDTVTMLGATDVPTNIGFYRIYKAEVQTSGVTGTNEGIISIKNNGATATYIKMLAGEGATSSCTWTCPAGQKALFTRITGEAIGAQNSTIMLMCRELGGSWVMKAKHKLKDGTFDIPLDSGIQCAAMADIEVRVTGSATAPEVSARLEGRAEET